MGGKEEKREVAEFARKIDISFYAIETDNYRDICIYLTNIILSHSTALRKIDKKNESNEIINGV